MECLKQNLENTTQNMMKRNEDLINWRKFKQKAGIDMELLRKMKESIEDLEKNFKRSYKGISNKNSYY